MPTIQAFSGDYFIKLLRDLYSKAGASLPQTDFDTVQRLVDEERAQDEVTKAWVSINKDALLKSPVVYNPDFRTSPLHVFHAYMQTDATITHDTFTPITFETSAGDTSIFDFYGGDKSKIILNRTQLNVIIDGIVRWEPSATGDRVLRINVYGEDDISMGTNEISVVEPPGGAGIPSVMNFSYCEDIRGLFEGVAYFTMEVKQTSGGDLDVVNFIFSARIA